jgi:uncharacterized protein YndB with AHSA1/START domain
LSQLQQPGLKKVLHFCKAKQEFHIYVKTIVMEKLNFSIDIKAPIQKVWDTLWADETYRKWTAAFSEGSYAESDWNEGSRILFLSPAGDGMLARIAEKREPHILV